MKKNIARLKTSFGVLAWVALGFGLTVHWVSNAQQNSANDDPRFTGLSTGLAAEGLGVSRRHFEAGARSAWHHHTHGQLLFVEQGGGRTQKRNGPLIEMEVGDSDYTRPDVVHWHGAAADRDFVQIAVGFGAGIEWLDKVTDEEYNGR